MVEVLKAWAESSSNGVTTYEVLVRTDGSMSCDCPGWVYCRRGQPRSCKHVRLHEAEAKILVGQYEKGGVKALSATAAALAKAAVVAQPAKAGGLSALKKDLKKLSADAERIGNIELG
jgi:hypothetical protein